MYADYVIKNGRVIDPATGTNEVKDVVISGYRIVDPKGEEVTCPHVIDATDCLVVPGLIDFHCHLFSEGSNICIHPDLMIPQGTVAAVDAGSAGTATFEAFYQNTIARSLVKIKTYLTLFAGGQLDPKAPENFNHTLYNLSKAERLVDKYRDNILGFKIRLSKGVVPDDKAEEYLKGLIDQAEEVSAKTGTNLGICIHTTNPPIDAGRIAEILRPGDIYTHCYQGAGSTIVLEDGTIDPRVLEARRRGVIFDSANGKGNFGIKTCQKALAAGFYPDVISSDLTNDKFNMPPYAKNLLLVMSKYLSLGLPLTEVIRATTQKPAELMGLAGEIGTLKPGARACVTVLKHKDVEVLHKDFQDDEFVGHDLLVNQMTIIDGEIQYCQTDFWN